jgi:hypothetical protein
MLNPVEEGTHTLELTLQIVGVSVVLVIATILALS